MTINKSYEDTSNNRYTTMRRRRRECGQICLLLGGIVLVSTGISIFIFFEQIYEYILKDGLKFTPTSKPFNMWRKNDPPLEVDFYLFNWTNPEDIYNNSVKPRFEQVGPYRFKEVKEKINITWHDNNTVSYRHRQSYFYDEENSVRNFEDVITTINAVPLTAAYRAKDLAFLPKMMLSVAFSSVSKMYVEKTAREILFDGYEDSILSVLSRIPMMNVKDKFGLFYGRNGTDAIDGIYNMAIANDENFGRLLSWNHKNHTDFYHDHCNDIKGSAGEFFPLNRKRDRLLLYSSQLCKYAELEYESDVIIKGVRGYKFSADNIFDNGTTRPENACFCNGECIPSGVLDVSTCRENSPSFLSLPHFFNADPYYTSQVEGLHPERHKHEFYITIEPKSGIIMDIAARMQLNMLLQPIRSITLYSNVPKVYIPLFFFDQKINLSDELASDLRLIQNLPEYCNYASLILVCIGAILVIWSICSVFCSSVTKEKTVKKLPENTPHEEVPLNEKL